MTLPLILSFFLFLLLMAGISAFGYRRYARPGKIYERLGQPVGAVVPEILGETGQSLPKGISQVLQQIGNYVPISPMDASIARRSLITAGFRSDHAVAVYYGIKVVAGVGLVLAAMLLRDSFSQPMHRILALIAAGAAGYFGPGFLLDKSIDKRQKRLRS